MKITSSHKYTGNTSTSGTLLRGQWLNTNRKTQNTWKYKRDLLWKGEKKKEMRNGNKSAPVPQGGSWRGREVPIPGEVTSPAEGSAGTGKVLWRLREKNTAAGLQQVGQWDLDWYPCHSLVCPSLRLPTTDVGRGPGLECHVWRAGPGTELQLARQRQLEGVGGQSTIAAKVPGVGPDSHRDGASLLDDVQGATTVAPLHMEAPAA